MRAWRARRGPRGPKAIALHDDYREQVDRRRAAAARLVSPDVAARISSAPPGYMLAHGSSDIARHCELLSPLPAPGEARVVVTPGRGPSEWHLDVAGRDRPGLLAAFTGVLAASDIDVLQAVVATWDDGAALEAYVVRSASAPDATALELAFEASLLVPLAGDPIPDAVVTFDDDASPVYTRCDVHAPDRHGLLHALAMAMATAGADVHAAAVTTVDGVAHDRFDLSDPTGQKLYPELKDVITTRITGARAEMAR